MPFLARTREVRTQFVVGVKVVFAAAKKGADLSNGPPLPIVLFSHSDLHQVFDGVRMVSDLEKRHGRDCAEFSGFISKLYG
jgi:hypothetical protein